MRQRLPSVLGLVAGLWLVGIAFWTCAELLGYFFARFDYPMDIEWMEGGQLYHGYRIMQGKDLYADCSDGFMAFAYPPMHAVALALVGKIAYLDYAPARLLSIACFVAMVAVLGRQMWRAAREREMGRWGRGLVVAFGVATMAASYYYTGHWYDIVRVDSLYLLFLVLGLSASFEFLESEHSWRHALFPVSALVLAVFTKQTALLFLPWLSVYALYRSRRRGAQLLLLIGVGLLSVFLLLMGLSQGRFFTYVVSIMGQHPLIGAQAAVGVWHTLAFAPYWLLVPFLSMFLVFRGAIARRSGFWLGAGISALLASWVTAAKIGAYLNNLATALLFSGVVVGMLTVDFLRERKGTGPWPKRWSGLLALAAGGMLFLYQSANRPVIPEQEQRLAAKRLNSLIGGLKGGVLVPGHSFLPVRNGHRNVQIHEQAYVDYMGAGLGGLDVVQCRQELDADWLIVNVPTNPYHLRLFAHGFEAHARLPVAARTSVGMYTRPVMLLKRVDTALPERRRLRRRVLFDFEDGSYQGFAVRGRAFTLPTNANNGYQHPIAGIRGRFAASSYSPKGYDGAMGWLETPPFRIDRERLGFRMGGGRSDQLAVELLVNGNVKRRLTTQTALKANLELLLPFSFDLTDLQGKLATVRVIDASRHGWGHLMVDAIELYDRQPQAPAAE